MWGALHIAFMGPTTHPLRKQNKIKNEFGPLSFSVQFLFPIAQNRSNLADHHCLQSPSPALLGHWCHALQDASALSPFPNTPPRSADLVVPMQRQGRAGSRRAGKAQRRRPCSRARQAHHLGRALPPAPCRSLALPLQRYRDGVEDGRWSQLRGVSVKIYLMIWASAGTGASSCAALHFSGIARS
jgi:hypothetical protein